VLPARYPTVASGFDHPIAQESIQGFLKNAIIEFEQIQEGFHMQVGNRLASVPQFGKQVQFGILPGQIGEWKKKQEQEKERRQEQSRQIPLYAPEPDSCEKPPAGDKEKTDGGYNFFA
jgi:hypothetical protein